MAANAVKWQHADIFDATFPVMGSRPKTPAEFAIAAVRELFDEMEQRGMNQAQVAAKTGLDTGMVSRLRSGLRMMDLDQFQEICGAIGVAPHIIIQRAEQVTTPRPAIVDEPEVLRPPKRRRPTA